jgi:hypothetical protein
VPWRGPEEPGEFPTLGYLIGEYIESSCAIPDRDQRGQRFMLTDEQWRFLLWFYRLRLDATEAAPEMAWQYSRGGQLVRPQKWGKGPFAAACVCAEADGPVRFAGWDANGEAVGRRWATPLIQITAVSEDQTDNVWRPLLPMIELGDIAADIPDTGETRINLSGGGKIEPVTASARSRLGNPATFAVQDEAHSWLKRNGGRALADNQRRNIAGMGGRWLETTNAWDPGEESVAQSTRTEPGVYWDDVEPPKGSIRNRRERRRCLQVVYGDSWKRDKPEPDRSVNGWVNLDRIDDEIDALLARDPAQAERFFLNRKRASEGAFFDAERWAELRRLEPLVYAGATKREYVTAGFDGSKFHDSTGLVGTHVETGYQWVAGVWERPSDVTDEDWEVDEADVEARITELFDTWRVWRLYGDPPYWEEAMDRWVGKWGARKVVKWWTNRDRQMAFSLKAYREAITAGTISHDGDEFMAKHMTNARKRETTVKDDDGKMLYTIRKEAPKSPDKIDLAMAGCLSWEARGDAIASGLLKRVHSGSGVSF